MLLFQRIVVLFSFAAVALVLHGDETVHWCETAILMQSCLTGQDLLV